MDGGVDQGPWLQERVGGGVGAMAVRKKGESWGLKRSKSGKGSGKGWLGGRGGKGFGCGGVGGRGTGPRRGANFATGFCRFVQKEEKWLFLKDALWGGGVPTGAGLVDARARGGCKGFGSGRVSGRVFCGVDGGVDQGW